jgi:hypothetical protein
MFNLSQFLVLLGRLAARKQSVLLFQPGGLCLCAGVEFIRQKSRGFDYILECERKGRSLFGIECNGESSSKESSDDSNLVINQFIVSSHDVQGSIQ